MSELLSNDELLDFLSIGEDDSRYHAVNQLLERLTAALSTVQESLTVEKEGTCEWIKLGLMGRNWRIGCWEGYSNVRSDYCPHCGKRIVVKGEKG